MLLAALVAVAAWTTPSRADDAGSMLLVAKRELKDRLYGSTVLLAKPIGNDRHVGFIINKPTQATLGKLFPSHAPSQKVAEPVYLGGPVSPDVIFALVNRPDSPGGKSLKLAPDLYLAMETQVVDKIIEAEPQHARFVAGLVVWRPGELDSEMKRGLWYVLDARADLVLRKSEGLWEELVGRYERRENTI